MAHSLGTFNPNFYGISLTLGSQAALDTIAAYEEVDNLDHWEDSQNDFDLARLGVLSARVHELRHFHDFLLSPFACWNMTHRLQATANGLEAIKLIPHLPGRFLPTPLTPWLGKSKVQRAEWFEHTGKHAGLSGLDEIVPLPVIDFDATATYSERPVSGQEELSDFFTVVEVAARAYTTLEQGRERRDTGIAGIKLSTTDMFEATAHLTQAVYIYNTQGQKALDSFNNHLFESEQRIFESLRLFNLILSHENPAHRIKCLIDIFTWALLGKHNSADNPISRYCNAGALLIKAKEKLTDVTRVMPTAEVWDLLDQITKRTPWRKNLAGSLCHAQSTINLMEQSYLSDTPLKTTEAALLRVARRWLKDLEQMINAVSGDAGAYCHLENYVMGRVTNLPMPFTLAHSGHGIIICPESLKDTPTRINYCFDSESTMLLYSVIAPSSPRLSQPGHFDPEDLKAVLELFQYQKIIDYIFYEEPTTSNLDQVFFQQISSQTGKTPINVF